MDHVNWFNYEKAKTELLKAGFTTVYKSAYGQSQSPAMRDISKFDNWLPCISLYIEAIK